MDRHFACGFWLGLHSLVAATLGLAASAFVHFVVPHHAGLDVPHARHAAMTERAWFSTVHAELGKGCAEVIVAVAAVG